MEAGFHELIQYLIASTRWLADLSRAWNVYKSTQAKTGHTKVVVCTSGKYINMLKRQVNMEDKHNIFKMESWWHEMDYCIMMYEWVGYYKENMIFM